MSYSYSLNCGQYVLMEDDKPIGRVLDEVALCFSAEDGVLHKHGPQASVETWANRSREKYRAIGLHAMANDIVVVTGRIPLDELNKCLTTTGYVLQLHQRILDGQLPPQPLITAPAPRSPLRSRP